MGRLPFPLSGARQNRYFLIKDRQTPPKKQSLMFFFCFFHVSELPDHFVKQNFLVQFFLDLDNFFEKKMIFFRKKIVSYMGFKLAQPTPHWGARAPPVDSKGNIDSSGLLLLSVLRKI